VDPTSPEVLTVGGLVSIAGATLVIVKFIRMVSGPLARLDTHDRLLVTPGPGAQTLTDRVARLEEQIGQLMGLPGEVATLGEQITALGMAREQEARDLTRMLAQIDDHLQRLADGRGDGSE